MARTHLRDSPATPTTPPLPKGKFHLMTAEDLLHLPPPEWLVESVIGKRNFVVIFGAPDSYKSFVALHIALCVATGMECFGRKVKQGPVLYITGEGEEGFRQRVHAWEEAYPQAGALDQNRAIFLPEAVNLLDEDAVDSLIVQMKKIRPVLPALVVIDTLARSMVGGDGNSDKDVGIAVHAADRLKRAIGCSVIIIHHSTKGKKLVERGSSALRGAADTMITMMRTEDGPRFVCVKQKNAATFKTIPLSIVEVELGELVSSLTVHYNPGTDLTDAQRKTLLSIGKKPGGLTFAELEALVPKTSLRRALHEIVSMGLVRKPMLLRGGRYTLRGHGLSIVATFKRGRKSTFSPSEEE